MTLSLTKTFQKDFFYHKGSSESKKNRNKVWRVIQKSRACRFICHHYRWVHLLMRNLYIIRISLSSTHNKIVKRGHHLIYRHLKHLLFHPDQILLQLLIIVLVLKINLPEIEINKVLISLYKHIRKSTPFGINPITHWKK